MAVRGASGGGLRGCEQSSVGRVGLGHHVAEHVVFTLRQVPSFLFRSSCRFLLFLLLPRCSIVDDVTLWYCFLCRVPRIMNTVWYTCSCAYLARWHAHARSIAPLRDHSFFRRWWLFAIESFLAFFTLRCTMRISRTILRAKRTTQQAVQRESLYVLNMIMLELRMSLEKAVEFRSTIGSKQVRRSLLTFSRKKRNRLRRIFNGKCVKGIVFEIMPRWVTVFAR